MNTPELDPITAPLDLAEIAKRVRQMLAVTKLDGTEFAERTGVPYSTMRAYLTGNRAPSAEFLAGCFKAFGIMPSWLLTGEGAMARPDSALGSAADRKLSENYTVIPMLAIEASAGPGMVNEAMAAYTIDGMCVSLDWLRSKRLSPAGLRVIHVRGSSMEGVLSHGDRVLIDQADTQPRSGFVYVLRQGDELLIKYCQLLPGGILRVSSANPAYAPYDVDIERNADVAVVGRVVASMHEW